jgi:hypothetical protein
LQLNQLDLFVNAVNPAFKKVHSLQVEVVLVSVPSAASFLHELIKLGEVSASVSVPINKEQAHDH